MTNSFPKRRSSDLTIVEIKVSRADLHGDGKWPDYCDWCDRFYWALAAGLDPAILETEGYRPKTSGLIVADRYGAAAIGRAHVCTQVTNAHLVCRLLLEQKKNLSINTIIYYS